ncbi:MAG: SDR family oxidoreductase [Elusimicrobia bacterium]|nr:SDR family oxidoreductase [Elusimicrobiota bacterium]
MISPLRALVIGATGLIGNALVRAWERRGAEVVGCDHRCLPSGPFIPLDFTQDGRLAAILKEVRPAVVAVPAANPHVDFCEAHPEQTRKVNVEAPAMAARLCSEARACMVFYSSDYVFDGGQPSYGEDDPVSPVNEYGRQKAEAERAVLAAGKHLVIRSSGVYGWQWVPKNFVLQVLRALSSGERLRVAHDIRYNPTSAENLAEVTAELCSRGASGIFNVVGVDRLARAEFARRVARVFGLAESLIEAVPSAELSALSGIGGLPPSGGPAPLRQAQRPKESSLRTDKARALLRLPLWGAVEGLSDMLRRRAAWEEYARLSLPTPGSF